MECKSFLHGYKSLACYYCSPNAVCVGKIEGSVHYGSYFSLRWEKKLIIFRNSCHVIYCHLLFVFLSAFINLWWMCCKRRYSTALVRELFINQGFFMFFNQTHQSLRFQSSKCDLFILNINLSLYANSTWRNLFLWNVPHTQFTSITGLSILWLALPFFLFCIPMDKNDPLFVLGSPKNGVKKELDFCLSVSPPPAVRADVTSMY